MDYRGGHPWADPGRHSHRGQDREGQSRTPQNDPHYPQPKPREHDRHWAHPEAYHRANVRPEPYPYASQHGYYQRPPSRHDHAPHSNWDYKDAYGYYDYYRGRQDPVQWGQQDSWRADQYYERTHKQEPPRIVYPEEYRYDQGNKISQQYMPNYEDSPSRDNDDISSFYLSNLESSKNSGLSSSSYELNQYMNGADHTDHQPAEFVHQAAAPLKYSIPHAVVSFGPAGQLIRVSPAASMQENISHLEIHSLEVILSETPEQHEMRNFPGPLTREDLHKVDAIEFAQQRAGVCMRDEKLLDKGSAALLWNLLILLCRQNGQIVGSDIAELLMQGSRTDGSLQSATPTLIDFNEDAVAEAPSEGDDDLLTGNASSFGSASSEKCLRNYTRLLLAGRKKEALEEAMSGGLWGHALFLASKMDNRSYTTVLNRFTGQLTASDPLQTFFQLLSGRIPAAATCCGNEKWGDWKPHLAVMLSNEAVDPAAQQKAITTMGDTLASRGLVHAAHVCYLAAGVPFGVFPSKAERLVLLGSSHRQSFGQFATNASIQCTELYEYCQALLDKSSSIPCFQVYKFLYACRLLDCGLPSLAFHYCEVVGGAILRQKEPFLVLTGELIKLSERLMSSEGQFSEALGGAVQEPDWLKHLRARYHSLQTGSYDYAEIHPSGPVSGAWTREDEPDLSELTLDEPAFLYYHDSKEPESLLHQSDGIADEGGAAAATPWGAAGTQDWNHANAQRVPALVVGPPPPLAPTPAVAASQHLHSHHSTDSAEVGDPKSYCPQSHLPNAAEGIEGSFATEMMSPPVLSVDSSHSIQSQQMTPQGSEHSTQTTEAPKQGAKTGWFSGWFKSKAKDVQTETSEPQTESLPTPTLSPPPPPAAAAAAPPSTFPPQSSSGGINPFSRKAGLQLG
ncbi:unnamed protein product [Ophioblennius macclurei]